VTLINRQHIQVTRSIKDYNRLR